MDQPPYTIDYYVDPDGRNPFDIWARDLDDRKQRALVAAIGQLLAYLGPDVCETELGTNLGRGLYELRIRHTEHELRTKFAQTIAIAEPDPEQSKGILLRVFFHVHGKKIVLLLGGYDKAHRSSSREQSRQIRLARRRLKEFKSRRQSTGPKH